MILSDQERLNRLRLIRSENVGAIIFDQLIEKFGSAAAALDGLPELTRKRPIRICGIEDAQAEFDRADAAGARFVAKPEPDYPPLLRHSEGAPPLLCVKGKTALLAQDAVAIVGSRNASANGKRLARTFAADLAAAGLTVVSGLARGIDTAAHQASLARGTVAVLGTGIDVIYPPENADLQKAIGKDGLLISEMSPGAPPRETSFPRRNRIISGMSRAVIIVEAALRSGSLITARFANEQGREVFAVPGSPLDPRAEGTNRLISEGAHLLSRSQEVLDALVAMQPRPVPEAPPGGPIPDTELDGSARAAILSHLSPTPTEIDDLIRESGVPAQLVLGLLLELELAGKLTRHGRQLVSLVL